MLGSLAGYYQSLLIVVGGCILIIIASTTTSSSLRPATLPNANPTPITQQISYWKQVLDQQPTSRDVAWNLHLLYQAKNQPDLASKSAAQALLVDPNYNFPN